MTRAAVVWGYRLILGREPESEAVVEAKLRNHRTVAELRAALFASAEFRAGAVRVPPQRATRAEPGAVEAALVRRLGAHAGPGEPGFWHDFLGTRTRLDFLLPRPEHLSGRVEPPPGSGEPFLHAPEERGALLRAAAEAEPRGRLAVVELGAGWGPWLCASALLARRLGIGEVRLLAVEADPGHLGFLRTHFLDNGIDPDGGGDVALRTVRAAVAASDGPAWFPALPDPAAEWGARARFAPGGGRALREVPGLSIATLVADMAEVDLLHADLQGDEAAVLPPAMAALSARVRRVVVGTHGRGIEEALLRAFGDAGWELEADAPCAYAQADGDLRAALSRDGTQAWRNPRL